MIIIKGYRWTFLDILLAALAVCLWPYFVFTGIYKAGISLGSLSGGVWVLGIALFFFLYQFPIFGGRVEGKKIISRGPHIEIHPKILKNFFIFFIISGGLSLIGIFAGI